MAPHARRRGRRPDAGGRPAAVDEEVAVLLDRMGGEFYANQRRIVEHLAAGGQLRSGLTVSDATDLMYAINHSRLYLVLVEERGWSPERYEEWLADALTRELLRPAP